MLLQMLYCSVSRPAIDDNQTERGVGLSKNSIESFLCKKKTVKDRDHGKDSGKIAGHLCVGQKAARVLRRLHSISPDK